MQIPPGVVDRDAARYALITQRCGNWHAGSNPTLSFILRLAFQ